MPPTLFMGNYRQGARRAIAEYQPDQEARALEKNGRGNGGPSGHIEAGTAVMAGRPVHPRAHATQADHCKQKVEATGEMFVYVCAWQ